MRRPRRAVGGPAAWRCAVAAGLAAALLNTVGASAQEAPAPPPQPTETTPAAIALPDVIPRGERAERLASSIERRLGGFPDVRKSEEHLAALAPSLAARADRIEVLSQDAPSVAAVQAEIRFWRQATAQLEALSEAPTARLSQLEAWIAELEAERAVWRATSESARAAEAPREVAARIDAVSARLAAAQRATREQRSDLVALQARIAQEQSRAQDRVEGLERGLALTQPSLLRRNRPPIWSVLPAEDAGRSLANVVASLRDDGVATRRYVALRPGRLQGQLALFALTLLLVVRLRPRAEHVELDERLAASRAIFERPVSAAALIALAATSLFHPDAPDLLLASARAALTIPVLRLLPVLVEPNLRAAIFGAAALSVSDELRALAASAPLAERALLFLETSAGAALLASLARAARAPSVAQLSLPLRRALRAGFWVLAAASLGNLVGFLDLARLLGDATIASGYLAVVLYGGVRVLRAGIRAALRSALAERAGIGHERAGVAANRVARVANLAAIGLWAGFSLSYFELWDGARHWLRGALALEISFGDFAVSLRDVVAFTLTLFIANRLARAVRFLLEEDPSTPRADRRSAAGAIAAMAQYALLFVGILVAFSAAGFNMDRVAVLAGAFGVGIGFGLQNVVNNFVSGLILLFERPIQVGDSIELGGLLGDVRRIGIRSSTVRTWQGADVVVPNADLISNQVINWTLSDRQRRIDVTVGVAYGTEPRRVLSLLEEVARGHPEVLRYPPPRALFMAFGESSLDFEIRAWCANIERWFQIRSELTLGIHEALAAANIAIPFPQRDLHVKTVEPAAARALSGGDAAGEET